MRFSAGEESISLSAGTVGKRGIPWKIRTDIIAQTMDDRRSSRRLSGIEDTLDRCDDQGIRRSSKIARNQMD